MSKGRFRGIASVFLALALFSAAMFSPLGAGSLAFAGDKPVWPESGSVQVDKTAAQAGENTWTISLSADSTRYGEPMDILLAVDGSASSVGLRYQAAREFVEEVLALNPKVRIAVMSFGTRAVLQQDFTNDPDLLEKAVRDIGKGDGVGSTLQSGLHLAREIFASSDCENKIMVFISDGMTKHSYKVTSVEGITYNDDCDGKRGSTGTFTYSDDIKITGCDYTKSIWGSVRGSDCYGVACYKHGDKVQYHYSTYPSSHAEATLYEADCCKDEGIEIISVCLRNRESGVELMTGIASEVDGSPAVFKFNSNEEFDQVLMDEYLHISRNCFNSIRGGTVTDPMSEYVILDESSIQVSQGSYTVTEVDGIKTINWTVGDVTPGTTALMTYNVSLKDEYAENIDDTFPANGTTTLDYTNYEGDPDTELFPIPELAVKGGKILVNAYRVNLEGKPIDETGAVVASPLLAQQLCVPYNYTVDGKTVLPYGSYSIDAPEVEGFEYQNIYNTSADGAALSEAAGEKASVSVSEAQKHGYVYFGYYKAFNDASLTITKSGCAAEDAGQSFIFTIEVTPEEGDPFTFKEVIIGNDTRVIDDLPYGTYKITEDTSWSWRYTPDNESATVELDYWDKDETVTFVNTKTSDKFISIITYVVNLFK